MKDKHLEITIQPDNKRITVPKGSNLLSVLTFAGVTIPTLCNHNGSCGKCRVILRTVADEPSDVERFSLGEALIGEGYRLACKTIILNDCEVVIPQESVENMFEPSYTGEEISQISKMPYAVEPHILQKEVNLASSKILPVDKRVLAAVGENYSIRPSLIYHLKEKASGHSWAVLNKSRREVTDIIKKPTAVLAALDIGTTTIAGYLFDAAEGKLLSASTIFNPTTVFGGDVISRLTFAATNPDGTARLHRSLLEGVRSILQILCKRAERQSKDIYQIAVCGNTIMQHIFIGIDASCMGIAPYEPTITNLYNIRLRHIKDHKVLGLNQNIDVLIMPAVTAFIGGDAVACALAVSLHKKDRLSLIIDLGTNGEMLLGHKKGIWAASASAGPAFEGYSLSSGMRAGIGAIEYVAINNHLNVKYRVVGGTAPVGLCGSGAISAMAHLVGYGFITEKGHLKASQQSQRFTDGGFVIASAEETSTGRPITLTRKDIEALQSAKAAFACGISYLIKAADVSPEDIENVYLAGAFGNRIEVDDLKVIGLMPSDIKAATLYIGNAAGIGVSMALLSDTAQSDAQAIAGMTKHVNLGGSLQFEDEFVNALFFKNSGCYGR